VTVPPPGQAPGNQPVIHRSTARVLPVDDDGRVLLLHGWDPHHPEETRISVEPERPAHPDIPDLVRAAAASAGNRHSRE
jgi:hypothetical protein